MYRPLGDDVVEISEKHHKVKLAHYTDKRVTQIWINATADEVKKNLVSNGWQICAEDVTKGNRIVKLLLNTSRYGSV